MDDDHDLSQQTADLLALADTERWTTVRTMRSQSVAEHAFGVTVISVELASRLQVREAGDLVGMLLWATAHDMPENITGDIDGRFKRMYPEIAESIKVAECAVFKWYAVMHEAMPPHLRMLVKTADNIEGIAFIRQWGIGAQADAVYQELRAILYRQTVPKLAAEFPHLDRDDVYEAVNRTTERILSQTHTYRMRHTWPVAGA